MFIKRNILDHLYEALKVIKITATERRLVVARDQRGGRNGELLLHEYRVSVVQDEKSYGDGL